MAGVAKGAGVRAAVRGAGALAVGVTIASVVLAGCSDDGAGDSAGPTTQPPTTQVGTPTSTVPTSTAPTSTAPTTGSPSTTAGPSTPPPRTPQPVHLTGEIGFSGLTCVRFQVGDRAYALTGPAVTPQIRKLSGQGGVNPRPDFTSSPTGGPVGRTTVEVTGTVNPRLMSTCGLDVLVTSTVVVKSGRQA